MVSSLVESALLAWHSSKPRKSLFSLGSKAEQACLFSVFDGTFRCKDIVLILQIRIQVRVVLLSGFGAKEKKSEFGALKRRL